MSSNYEYAKKQYENIGVDVEKALLRLGEIAISLHCWQGDDVAGFENTMSLDGGLAVTGGYPGAARNADELRQDIDKAMSLIPGKNRLNLHAIYAETNGKKVERNELTSENFSRWIDWAKANNVTLDFNPSYFAHPKAASGFTLSSSDDSVRQFWIEHGIACRKIAETFGKELNDTCITNFWVPDGYKDTPVDRLAPRVRLTDSLDKIFAVDIDQRYNRDAVESKLFGIGTESYTVGSNEFYLSYAMSRGKMVCLDAGHFHPTEVISDKLSSVLAFSEEVLLHVSRGVRWDSDHVIVLSDELKAIGEEVVRHNFEKRIHIGLDYFDASINRIAAWVIGTRNMYKSLLMGLLEPTDTLRKAELSGDYTTRLAMLEEIKTMPFGAIWEEYCERCNVIADHTWIDEVKKYENDVLLKR